LFKFYNRQYAPFRFFDYQERQRANNEMANILLNGGKKYNNAKRKKPSKINEEKVKGEEGE
ncbi:hypothetical protein BD770DRAFT_324804, partial [Pilaira anomala]